MTRQEAQERADELNHAEPAGGSRHWTVRETPTGEWEVVGFSAPGLRIGTGPQGTLTRQGPEPQTPPDPRPSGVRQIPPLGPGF